MNFLINTYGLSVNEVADICNYHRRLRKFKIKALTERVLTFTAGRGKPHKLSDIELSHQILDLKDTIFICENFNFGCPDLIARALQSTRGIAVQSLDVQESLLSAHLNFHSNKFPLIKNTPTYAISTLPPVNRGPGTGCYSKNCILLVGEKPGKPASLGARDAAFFSTQASSRFLRQEIAKTGITEENFYWVNAHDRQGVLTNWDFIKHLKPRLIITLGKIPDLELTKAGIDHTYVPHPSYWKRFHSKDVYPLINELTKVL